MRSAADPLAVLITTTHEHAGLQPETFGQRQAVARMHTHARAHAYPRLEVAIDLGCKVLWATVAMVTGSQSLRCWREESVRAFPALRACVRTLFMCVFVYMR